MENNQDYLNLINVTFSEINTELIKVVHLLKTDLTQVPSMILLNSSCTTWEAISFLTKDYKRFANDVVMLSRAVIEKLTNFLYLQVTTEDEKTKFLLHPYYREYHNMNTSKFMWKQKIWFSFSWQNEYKKNDAVKRALDIFSETNPRLSWSNKNIHEKLTYIDSKVDTSVIFWLFSNLTIYSNASECLHGSLYWITFLGWIYSPTDENHSVDKNIAKNNAILLLQISWFMIQVLNFLNKEYNLKIGNCLEEYQKKLKQSLEHLEKIT